MTEAGKSPVAVGEVLAGKYRVERLLGVGGMGVVVAATHLELGQRVAVKFLLPELMRHPEASLRFMREARAAVKIQSEHVARVLDVGRLESGAPYMVMEYLEGRDLAGLLQEYRPVRVESAVQYLLEACEALAEAHASGIVHRDLKPSNLFLARRSDGIETIKVLDFGISKVVVEGEAFDIGLTSTSALMGSPLYMSPEQMKSARSVDARADIWALGAILYELLAGFPPFRGDSMPQICAAILIEEPTPIPQVRPDVPPELNAVVLRCLSKIPDYRFPHVGELAVALLPFAPRRSRASLEKIARFIPITQLIPSSDVPAFVPKATVPDVLETRPSAPSEPGFAPRPTSRPPPPSAAPGSATAASWEHNRPPARRSRGVMAGLLVAGLGVFATLAILAAVFLREPKDAGAPSASTDPGTAAAALPVSALLPVSRPPTPEPRVEPPAAPSASASGTPASVTAPEPAPPARRRERSPSLDAQRPSRAGQPSGPKSTSSQKAKDPNEPSPMSPPPAADKPAPKSPLHIEIK